MSATAFQRRRRELAAKLEQEQQTQGDEANEQSPIENVVSVETEQTAADELNIDEMDKDELLTELKNRGINKPVNTGIKKLKEALKNANK